MKSWKTTVGGLLSTIGLALAEADGITGTIGTVLAGLGTLLIGLAARDNGVSSEAAGAK